MSEFADWTRAFVMMAHDGTVYRPVLVDELGHLYALLQGMTPDDELRTVRLDDEGRLSAFIIDSTDAWNRMLTIGNAELAVRLGSPVAYDRRGQVILVEDFEKGWNRWGLLLSGVGADATLDPTTSATGGYSAKLTAGTTVNKFSYLQFRRGILPVGRVGLEFSFAVPGTVQWVFGILYIDDGAGLFNGRFEWRAADDGLYIWDTDAGMVSVGTGKLVELHKQRYNVIKVVVDLSEECWVRLLFNQQEIDISAHPLAGGAPGATPRITLNVGMYGTGGAGEIAYVDDIILTFAEP